MGFKNWLHTVEVMTTPPPQTESPALKQMKAKVASAVQAKGAKAATGAPTEDLRKTTANAAQDVLKQQGTDAAGAADIAGMIEKMNKVANPQRPGSTMS